MNTINPVLQHTVAEGIPTSSEFIVAVNEDRNALAVARMCKGDDTFMRLDIDSVLDREVGEKKALVHEEDVAARTITFRVIDPDWKEDKSKSSTRASMHLNGNNGCEANIKFIRNRNALELTLIEDGKVLPTGREEMSMADFSRAIGIAENFVHNWKEDKQAA